MPYKLPKTVLIFSAVTCLLIRVWIKLTMISPLTGFYSSNSPVLVFFNVLLGVSAVALLALCLVQKPVPDSQLYFPRDSVWVKISSLACALGAFAAAVGGALDRYEIYLDESSWSMLPDETVFFYIKTAGGFLLFAALPAVVGVILLLTGARPSFRPGAFAALALPVWLLGLTIVLFLRFTTLRSVSDQQLGLVTLICTLPFSLAWARVYSGVDYDRGARQLMLFGFVTALFTLTIPTGMLAGAVAGRPVQLALPLPLCVFLVLLALYIITLLFSAELRPRPLDEHPELPEPPAEPDGEQLPA